MLAKLVPPRALLTYINASHVVHTYAQLASSDILSNHCHWVYHQRTRFSALMAEGVAVMRHLLA